MNFEKIDHIAPLLSTPNLKKSNLDFIKKKPQPKHNILKNSNRSYAQTVIFYITLLVWCIIVDSYQNQLKKYEKPILLRIYNSNLKDSIGFIFEIMRFYVDYDLVNLFFLILSYFFLNNNHISGYIFTIKVITINVIKSILQIIFQAKRPFWEIDYFQVQSRTCFRTFSLPDTPIFCTLSFCYFAFHLFKSNVNVFVPFVRYLIIFFNLFIAINLIADGQIYVHQIISTYVYFILIEQILRYSYRKIEKTIEALVLYKNASHNIRKYLFMISLTGMFFNFCVEDYSINSRSISDISNYVE